MAIYRQIHISFWQDEFILNLTPDEKFFYLYLMTNSKTTQCGIYELPKKVMEFETGYNRETIENLLKRFIDYGKVLYCDETKEVMLVNWLKYNNSTSPKVKARIKAELEQVKNTVYIQYLYSMDSLCIPVRNNNNNNNKNNNKNNNNIKVDRVSTKDVEKEFDELWKLYPRKVGKSKALDYYKKYRKKNQCTFEDVKKGIELFNKHIKVKKIDNKFIPHGSTWFNQKRWEDDLDMKPNANGKNVKQLPDWYNDYTKNLKNSNQNLTKESDEETKKMVKEMFG